MMGMSPRQLQVWLSAQGAVPLAVDGIFGKHSLAAMDALFAKEGLTAAAQEWAAARRLVALEQLALRAAGCEVGAVDGLAGPQMEWAREQFAARTNPAVVLDFKDKDLGKAVVEVENAVRWPRQREVETFYGKPGSGLATLTMPFALRIAWEPAQRVSKVQVHGKCREAFEEVWKRTLDHYGIDEVRRLRLDLFGGCLASPPRKMRGGSRWSMHSWAIAWDVDPERNQLKWGRDRASLDGTEYAPFWAIVRGAGGLALGPALNYDWMHFQFTRDFS